MPKKRTIREITKLMFKNWKSLLLILTFDILFILLLSQLRFIQISLDNIFFPLFINKKASWIYSLSYVIFEFILVILTYSFFKYLVITFIQEIYRKTEFKLKSFFSFFKLNLITLIPLIIIFILFLNLVSGYFSNVLLQGGVDPFKIMLVILAVGILFLILFIYIYTLINLLHFTFLKEQSLKKLIKRSIINSWKLDYYKLYWNNFKIVIISAVCLLIIHLIVKSFIFDDFSAYIKYYGAYKLFITSVIALITYFLLIFNRFTWYLDISKGNVK